MDLSHDELAFFQGAPGALPLYERLKAFLLNISSEASIWVQKSQISFRSPHPFAWVWLPPRGGMRKGPQPSIALTFAAPFAMDSPRIFACVEPYPGRFTHHLRLTDPSELDEELAGWLGLSLRFRNP